MKRPFYNFYDSSDRKSLVGFFSDYPLHLPTDGNGYVEILAKVEGHEDLQLVTWRIKHVTVTENRDFDVVVDKFSHIGLVVKSQYDSPHILPATK